MLRQAIRHATDEGTFRRNVAFLIVVISVLTTLVGWRASEWSGRAADDRQRAVGLTLLREQALAKDRHLVLADLRALGPYAQHLRLAELLERDATAARRRGSADEAQRRHAEAVAERQLAAQTNQFTIAPTMARGIATYDPRNALKDLTASDSAVDKYDPAPVRVSAKAAQRKSVDLTGIAALFLAALVFATLAQITRRGAREPFAGSAVLVAGVAEVLFLIR